MRRRRAPNARIPSRRSLATRRHVAASACSTASGSTSSAASLSRARSVDQHVPRSATRQLEPDAGPAGQHVDHSRVKRPASVELLGTVGVAGRVAAAGIAKPDITLQIPELRWP